MTQSHSPDVDCWYKHPTGHWKWQVTLTQTSRVHRDCHGHITAAIWPHYTVLLFPPAVPRHVSAEFQNQLSALLLGGIRDESIFDASGPQMHQCTQSRLSQTGSQAADIVHQVNFQKKPTFGSTAHKQIITLNRTMTKQLNYVAYLITKKAQKSRRNYEINTIWASRQHPAGMMLHFWNALSGKVVWRTQQNSAAHAR